MTAPIVSKPQRRIQGIGVKFTQICTTIIRQWPFNPHHHKYRETANLVVTRVPRLCANHGIWEHAPVRANFVDFAIGAIETGATETPRNQLSRGRAQTRAKSGFGVRTKSGKTRFVETAQMIIIYFPVYCYKNLLKFLVYRQFLPLKLIICHLDRQKVDYVLNGFPYGFRLGFHPKITTLKSAKANCRSAVQHPSVIIEYLAKVSP